MSAPAESAISAYRPAARPGKREAVRRWMVSLVFVLYWLLIFEGALRKWGVPQLEQVFFFIRVPVTLFLYWMAFYYRHWPSTTTPMLAFYLFAAVATILIPIQFVMGDYDRRYLLIAGYGWINYFFYIPLAFLIAEQFRQEDLRRLIRHTMWIALAAAPVVILQFISPPDSVINLGSGLDEENQFKGLSAVMGVVRPTGFFTSSLGQQMFVAGAAAMALAVFLQRKKIRALSPLLLWMGTAAIVVMIMFSQSRGLFLNVGLILAAAAVAGILTGKKNVVLRAIVWPVVLLVSAAILWPLLFPDTFEVFITRWTNAWRSESYLFQYGIFSRAFYGLYSFTYYIPETPVFGYLLGLGGNAASQLNWVQLPQAAFEWHGYGSWAELAWERHIIELGPAFGTLFIAFRVWLTIWLALRAVRATRLSRDPLPIILFGYASITLIYRQITGHGTAIGFCWLFVGFCLAAARIAISNSRTVPVPTVTNIDRIHQHAR